MRSIILAGIVLLLAAGCGSKRSDEQQAGGAAIPKNWERTKHGVQTDLLSDASAVPGLPAFVDLNTSETELGAHALVVAREDVDRGLIPDAKVYERHAQIYAAWRPLMKEKQAYLQKIQDDRKPVQERQLKEARQQAEHERAMAAVDADYDRRIRAEQLKTR